jgi:hypothetical protein
MIGYDDVGCARIVYVQHQHHRRRLRTILDQFVAHPDFQESSSRRESPTQSCRRPRWLKAQASW